MGRYKLGPNGGYYDPNDSGPDQFTPTPGQQVPGMPQQAQPSQGMPIPPGMPQFPRTPQGPSPNGWWDHAGENDVPGYDPNNQTPHEVQPWQGPTPYTGGYDPNGPMYGKPGSWGGGMGDQGNGTFITPSGQSVPRETGPPPGMSQEAWQQGEDYLNRIKTGQGDFGKIFGQSNPYQPLSSLGGKLGGLLNGGNIQPKQPSGGLAGAIFNKYPDLFKR